MELTKKQCETISELPRGWFMSHQDHDGVVWMKKRAHRMTGGPDEFNIITIREDGEIEEEE